MLAYKEDRVFNRRVKHGFTEVGFSIFATYPSSHWSRKIGRAHV